MIVWLSGNSGAGKTFTGDYLARCAEFTHIDGDELFWATTPAEKGLFSNLVKAFDHWFEGASAPVELWHPYFHVVLSRVRAAATTSARVCISLTVYHRETRDFLREHLPEHIFVLLRVSAPELLRRARVRFAEYAKSRGQPFERAFEEAHGLPAGSFTDADFTARTRAIMRGLQPLAPDEARCHELDADDGAPWAPLHALLGLPPPPTVVPVEEIAEVNYARFRKHAPKSEISVTTIVAGTFDMLHMGHHLMLHAAFHHARAVEFWVTDDAMAAEKSARCGQPIQSWAARVAALGAWADSQTPASISAFRGALLPALGRSLDFGGGGGGAAAAEVARLLPPGGEGGGTPYPYAGRHSAHVLTTPLGPAASEARFTDIVASAETAAGCDAINAQRVARGLPPLRVLVMPLLLREDGGGAKLSSTALRAAGQAAEK
jgi:phosphopantetheine adenylyltransferase/gluconate kinase